MRLSHRIWAGILLGIVAGNAIGLGSYILLRDEAPPEAASKPSPVIEIDSTSKAHRLAGLDAIERGDHEAAIAEFSAGLRTVNPAPDLPQLLSIAQNMRERELERIKEEADAVAAQEAETQALEEERTKEAAKLEEEARKAPEKDRPTLILVTSRPNRLAIEIDGKLRDMTPAKLDVSPGSHKIVLRQGKNRLYERTVRVKAGEVALVDADVTDALEPPAPAPPAEPEPEDEDEDVDVDEEPADEALAEASAGSTRVDPSLLNAFPYPDPTPAAATAEVPPPAEPPSVPPAEVSDAGLSVVPTPPTPQRQGRIPPEDIRRVVARYQRFFQDCYDDYRRVRPNLAGRVVIEVEVMADGEVDRGRVRDSNMRGSRRINDCLERAARRMEFPEPTGGPTVVSFALRFRPGE